MSYIRTLKPEFFRSESLARLPLRARVTFAGLWTEADGQGRAMANSRVLCGALWSLDDDISPRDVEDDLRALNESGHIVLYEVDGKRYYQVLQWEEHQAAQYRRHESKLPEPPLAQSGTLKSAEKCPIVLEVGSRNRNRNRTRDSVAGGFESDFDKCWQFYPRKLARKAALKAYIAQRRKAVPADVLLTAVQNYADAMRREGRDKDRILHGATFFGPSDRWEDYVEAPPEPKDELVGGAGPMFQSEEEREAWYAQFSEGKVELDG